eukprot:4946706-Prymnesium_polylepis.1
MDSFSCCPARPPRPARRCRVVLRLRLMAAGHGSNCDVVDDDRDALATSVACALADILPVAR